MDIYDMSSEVETDLSQVLRLLKHIERKVDKMQVDISHLTATEQKLVGVVDQVLTLVGTQRDALRTLSDQLAAAIAANDQVGNVALQSSIDAMDKNLADETAKIGAALTAATPTVVPVPTPAPAATEPTVPGTTAGTVETTGPVAPAAPGPTGTTGSSGAAETGATGSSVQTGTTGAPSPVTVEQSQPTPTATPVAI